MVALSAAVAAAAAGDVEVFAAAAFASFLAANAKIMDKVNKQLFNLGCCCYYYEFAKNWMN